MAELLEGSDVETVGGDLSAMFFLHKAPPSTLMQAVLPPKLSSRARAIVTPGLGDRPEGKYASKFCTLRSPAATADVRCENPCIR